MNFLLTEREGHTRTYWPERMGIRTKCSERHTAKKNSPRINIPQYGVSRLGCKEVYYMAINF